MLRANFVELMQLSEAVMIGHGLYAVYMFSLDVHEKQFTLLIVHVQAKHVH
jgi:hypothetical protein